MVCPLRGDDLRDELEAFSWLRTGQTFNELTGSLEELGYARCFEIARIMRLFAVSERHYEITVAGMRAYRAAHAFYSNGSGDLAS